MTTTPESVARSLLSRSASKRAEQRPIYLRAVDGLRGVAILTILTYHSGLYENGLFGVDMFFVLSGFLITFTTLRGYARRGAIGLKNFYVRRAKRLLPALALILAITLVATWYLADATDLELISSQGFSSLVYIANWAQLGQGESYWADAGIPSPLSHMWSLSVTEQFYLVWPPILALVLYFSRRLSMRQMTNRVAMVAGALLVVSILLPIVLWDGGNSDFLYMASHTHASGLMAGGLAGALYARWTFDRDEMPADPKVVRAKPAVKPAESKVPQPPVGYFTELDMPDGPRPKLGWRIHAVGAATIVLTLAIVLLSIQATTYHVAWLYQGGLGLVAVLGALLTLSLTEERTYASKFFKFIPFVEIGKMSYTVFLVHIPIYWIFDRLDPNMTPFELLVVGGVSSLIVSGLVHELFAEPLRTRKWNWKGSVALVASMGLIGAGFLYLPNRPAVASGEGGIKVLAVGDSGAGDLAKALGNHGDVVTITDASLGGCGIMSPGDTENTARRWEIANGCLPWEDRYRAGVSQSDPDVVVAALSWDAMKQNIDGKWITACQPEWRTRWLRQLDSMYEILMGKSETRVILMADVRELHPSYFSGDRECQAEVQQEWVESKERVRVMPYNGMTCGGKACAAFMPDGTQVFLDGIHYTDAGLDLEGRWLLEQVVAAAEGRPAPTIEELPHLRIKSLAPVFGMEDGADCTVETPEEISDMVFSSDADYNIPLSLTSCGNGSATVTDLPFQDIGRANVFHNRVVENLSGWQQRQTAADTGMHQVWVSADGGTVMLSRHDNLWDTWVTVPVDGSVDAAIATAVTLSDTTVTVRGTVELGS